MDKQQLLATLSAFIRQRPGLEFGNYGDASSYRSEMRGITRDLHHAQELLAAVAMRDGITAADLVRASDDSFSGRLQFVRDGAAIDYCTGQYWPTEYRKAACAVLSGALWVYWRTNYPKDPPRDCAKRILSRAVAKRWFN